MYASGLYLLGAFALIAAVASETSSPEDGTCSSLPTPVQASSLLQRLRKKEQDHTYAPESHHDPTSATYTKESNRKATLDAPASESEKHSVEGEILLDDQARVKLLEVQPALVTSSGIKRQAGTARSVLPPNLFEVGMQLLRTEEMLDAVVANTVVQSQFYAGESMTIRMVAGDAVDGTDAYGLSSLVPGPGMMSMIDIGGNYGRVSIAAFKKFPQMRIIAVEPLPSTYFLLRWNLWLNGVPEIELQEFYSNKGKAGVLPLNHGIQEKDEQVLGFCYTPPRTMQARMCDCGTVSGEHCQPVTTKSLNTLVTMFGGQEIDLLKVDCEGCELDVIPQLANLQTNTGLRVHRLAGELHAMSNEIEDHACQAEGGQWFVSICYQQGVIQALPTHQRCAQGPGRESCTP